MARLRHYVISIGVAVALGACGRSPPASVPAAALPASAAAPVPAAKATPQPPAVRVAPEWQSRVPELSSDQVPRTLAQARDALARGQLERGSSPGPGALELYLAVLAVEPGNIDAQWGVQSVLDALLERGRLQMRGGDLGAGERIELIVASLLPGHPDLPVFREHLTRSRAAAALVARAETAGKAGRFTRPGQDTVMQHLRQARKMAPGFEPIRASAERWNGELLERAWQAAEDGDFKQADAQLQESWLLLPGSAPARVMALRIVEQRQARTEALLARGNAAVDALRLDRADQLLAELQDIAAQPAGPEALRERIHIARHYGPFKPGQVFREKLRNGRPAPEMVVIPYGRFVMGATDADPQGKDSEMPRHEVVFARGFAIARNETTVEDFRRFVEATGYRTRATRAGHSTVYDEKGGVFSEHEGVDWRRDHVGRVASPALPVVHVTLQDAEAYASWLSRQTGEKYRLPSEAEFEYVLRAGTATVFPWGDATPARLVGNLPGDGDLSQVGRRWGNAVRDYRDAFWGPAPVRNFPEERFGTFDMIGNVSEWTLDCWHESYQRAPVDGSAWVNPGCPRRVARGASWASSLEQARSASRLPVSAQASTARLGFRLVREI